MMSSSKDSARIPIGLLRAAMTSRHVLTLMSGKQTHNAAVSFVAALVRYAEDSKIQSIIEACLPPDYAGNTLDELPEIIASARRKGFDEPNQSRSGPRCEPKAAEGVLELLVDAELFHDRQGEAFISMPQPGGGMRHYRLASSESERLIRLRYYRARGKSLSDLQLREAMGLLAAKAHFDGPEHETHVRVGGDHEAVYIDLASDGDQMVKIKPGSWEMTTECPVRFVRPSGLQPLPEPTRDGELEQLPWLLGLKPRTWQRLLAFMINALHPTGPYMCLLVDGEQGSGKSLLSSLVKRLIDPNAVQKLRLPRGEHDLMIQAAQNRLLVFDNASSLKHDISDALCSLATGSGFSTRQYYTDNESRTFTSCRPFIINGIGGFANKPDLMDRAISLSLPAMADARRKTEREIISAFEAYLPGLLGCLFDLIAGALANLPTTQTPKGLRMADAAKWIAAAEPAAGLHPGTLADSLVEGQEQLMGDWALGQPLVLALQRVVRDRAFVGTMGELLKKLSDDLDLPDRFRPSTPSFLSSQLTRLRPGAMKAGLFIELQPRTREGRLVHIWKEGQPAPGGTRGQQ
jgi:hypothetical protein